MSDPNDIIYGVHPVAEALKNPKRKIYSLKASKKARQVGGTLDGSTA